MIIWNEKNNRTFQNKEDQLRSICENVKMQSF